METVTVQISEKALDWDKSPKTTHIFKDWKEVSTFAYRLALQVGREVRVERRGNGSYYSPINAEEFLKNNR